MKIKEKNRKKGVDFCEKMFPPTVLCISPDWRAQGLGKLQREREARADYDDDVGGKGVMMHASKTRTLALLRRTKRKLEAAVSAVHCCFDGFVLSCKPHPCAMKSSHLPGKNLTISGCVLLVWERLWVQTLF